MSGRHGMVSAAVCASGLRNGHTSRVTPHELWIFKARASTRSHVSRYVWPHHRSQQAQAGPGTAGGRQAVSGAGCEWGVK